jgi:hypothetical protein
MIYTRRIVDPAGGSQDRGQAGPRKNLALIALDESGTVWTGDQRPFFGVVRVRRDLGQSSNLGAVLTTREDGELPGSRAPTPALSSGYFVELAVQS